MLDPQQISLIRQSLRNTMLDLETRAAHVRKTYPRITAESFAKPLDIQLQQYTTLYLHIGGDMDLVDDQRKALAYV